MHEAVREMTFEEEYEILQRESERVFANEKEDYEPPLANCVLRRALRCIRKLQEQPQADKWIPCEERLPECESGCETKELMFQMKDTGNIEVGYYGEGGSYRNRYFRTYRDMFEGVDVSDVIAWQPLPQAYKKEGAE